jgi:hypothetical protein
VTPDRGLPPATVEALISILRAHDPSRFDEPDVRASLLHGLICHVTWTVDATPVATIKFAAHGKVDVTMNATFAGPPDDVRKYLALCGRVNYVATLCERIVTGLPVHPLQPHSSERYQHHKGGVYEIDGIATIEATGEPAVVYRRSAGPIGSTFRWVRPLVDFMGNVGDKPRFRLLRDDELVDDEGGVP